MMLMARRIAVLAVALAPVSMAPLTAAGRAPDPAEAPVIGSWLLDVS